LTSELTMSVKAIGGHGWLVKRDHMLSRKLWGVLNTPVTYKYERLQKALLRDYATLHKVSVYLVPLMFIGWMFLCVIFPYVIIALSITFFSVQFAWKVVTALSRQHELGRYETLAVTPLGKMGGAWLIARSYCDPISSFAAGGLTIAGALAVLIVVLMTIFEWTVLPMGLIAILTVITAICIDYQQAMAASFLVSVLASTHKDSMSARLWVIGGCLTIQAAGYSVFVLILLWLLNNLKFVGSTVVQFALLWFAFVAATAALFAVREIIIMCLWRGIQYLVNDDVPVLSFILHQKG
jgi:hypothetical protein